MPYLAVALDAQSQAKLYPLAIYPILRADHLTLAHGSFERPADSQCATDSTDLSLIPTYDPAWLLGYGLGDTVTMRGLGWVANGRVQAMKVEIQGSSYRAWDGGILHITLSRQPEAKSAESNLLLATTPLEQPLDLELSGTVCWL